jgi:hypothetical protein
MTVRGCVLSSSRPPEAGRFPASLAAEAAVGGNLRPTPGRPVLATAHARLVLGLM